MVDLSQLRSCRVNPLIREILATVVLNCLEFAKLFEVPTLCSLYREVEDGKLSMSKRARELALLSIVVLVSACAIKPVSDVDRDSSRSFDGNWQVLVQKSPSTQFIEKWRFSCDPDPFDFSMRVTQGIAILGGLGGSGPVQANVGKGGKFAFVIPIESKLKESVASSESIVNGNITLYLSGNLSEKSSQGDYTIGVQQFGGQGCRKKVVFKRL